MSAQRVVLIVDDDPFIRKLILTTLEGVSEFELHEARDGEEALETALRESPRLVFLDIDMPRLNGFEACERLRAAPETAGATIVMLTAASEGEVASSSRHAAHCSRSALASVAVILRVSMVSLSRGDPAGTPAVSAYSVDSCTPR